MNAVAALAVKLAQIKVRPHVRMVGGKPVPVAGYIRDDSSPTLPELGDCYSVAFDLMLHPPKGLKDMKLVHATVEGRDNVKGIRFSHAWVEGVRDFGGGIRFRVAVDRANGNDVEMPAGQYRNLAVASDVHEYAPQQVWKLGLKTRHYGPWHEDEVARD